MTFEWLTGPQRTLTRFGNASANNRVTVRVSIASDAAPMRGWFRTVMGETNLGLIDCGGKSVLIDTCWDLKFTHEALRAAADILRDSPIELVVNTHSDGDHCWGNQLFADKTIIGTHACAKQMAAHRPEELSTLGAVGKRLSGLHVAGLDKFGHLHAQHVRAVSLRAHSSHCSESVF